ncbi:MAG: hypothetical protein GX640_12120 [Fibrobacter sp.]|nr:hypothetical protein [Fibrobacter sp.]
MITNVSPLMEINQQAIKLLYRELGVVNAVRFLTQFSEGYGNYTIDRNDILGKKKLDEIISEIKKDGTYGK